MCLSCIKPVEDNFWEVIWWRVCRRRVRSPAVAALGDSSISNLVQAEMLPTDAAPVDSISPDAAY